MGAGEAFGLALGPFDNWDRGFLQTEAFVNIEDAIHLLDSFLCAGVGRVTFVPIELGSAQEEFGAQFPAQLGAPLHD